MNDEATTTARATETVKKGKKIEIQKKQLGEISTKKQEANEETEQTVSKNNKTEVTTNQSTTNNQTRTSVNNTQTQQTASQPSVPAAPVEPVHVHDYSEPIYTTVHHEATGHYTTVVTGQQWVVDQAAWDETEQVTAYICNACGWYSINGSDASEIGIHILREHDGKSSYYTGRVDIGVIHHDEVGHYVDITEDQWVQDSEAYDEQVITGYRCSCGAIE